MYASFIVYTGKSIDSPGEMTPWVIMEEHSKHAVNTKLSMKWIHNILLFIKRSHKSAHPDLKIQKDQIQRKIKHPSFTVCHNCLDDKETRAIAAQQLALGNVT